MNPFDPGYYTENELRAFGIGQVGTNVRIAKNCVIVGDLANLRLGDHVRIDGFTTLIATGPIRIGSYIHVGSFCHFSGGDGITLEDFCNLSQGVKLYSRSDDYTGATLTNPMVPKEFSHVTAGPVHLGKHAILGANAVVLPNVSIGEGVAIGAQSLVKKNVDAWGIYAGCPVKRIRDRKRDLLALEAKFLRT